MSPNAGAGDVPNTNEGEVPDVADIVQWLEPFWFSCSSF